MERGKGMKKNKVIVSISISPRIWDFVIKLSKEWHCSKSWIVENLIYTALIRSGVVPDEDKQDSE